jgi:hypothetical protein
VSTRPACQALDSRWRSGGRAARILGRAQAVGHHQCQLVGAALEARLAEAHHGAPASQAFAVEVARGGQRLADFLLGGQIEAGAAMLSSSLAAGASSGRR